MALERIQELAEEIELKRSFLQEAEDALRLAEAAHLREIQAYLEIPKSATLAPWAVSILRHAQEQRVNPQWLASVVQSHALQLIWSNDMAPLAPTAEDATRPEEAYTYARNLLGREPRNGAFYFDVRHALEKATVLALNEEQKTTPEPERRMAAVYGWLHNNLTIIYDLRRPQFEH